MKQKIKHISRGEEEKQLLALIDQVVEDMDVDSEASEMHAEDGHVFLYVPYRQSLRLCVELQAGNPRHVYRLKDGLVFLVRGSPLSNMAAV